MIKVQKGVVGMLAKFEVENFKYFKEKLTLDLEKRSDYEFNSDIIKNGVIRAGIIFGKNGSGKSNLGLAIFDLVTHLTDKEKGADKYKYYFNLNSKKDYAKFNYLFKFNNHYLEYSYKKSNTSSLLSETISIDKKIVVDYDFEFHKGICLLKGAENLNKNLENTNISFVKYIYSNTVLIENDINFVFKQFMLFINNMLLFYPLQENHYHGFSVGEALISEGIIKRGKLNEFRYFLNEIGIKYDLIEKNIDDKMQIYAKFKCGEANFFSIASIGTKSLALFFFWLIQMEQMSFVFMDDFDAYYHDELSSKVVRYVIEKMNLQVLFTSQNTNLLTSDLLRPDCYYNIKNNSINTFSSLTDKELRSAHNLEKMYKAGAFDVK